MCHPRLVCADASKENVVPKGEQHGAVAVLEACRHTRRRAGRTTSVLALHQAGFFFSADTINYRIRPGRPQDTLLLTNTEIIFDKFYALTESTELASWGSSPREANHFLNMNISRKIRATLLFC